MKCSKKDALKRISRLSSNGKFGRWLAHPYIKHVQEGNDLSDNEVVVLSWVSFNPDFSKKLKNGNKFDLFDCQSALDNLKRRGFVKKSNDGFDISDRLVRNVVMGDRLDVQGNSDTLADFLAILTDIFNNASGENLAFTFLRIYGLIDMSELPFAKALKKMNIGNDNLMVYMYLCYQAELYGTDNQESIRRLPRSGIVDDSLVRVLIEAEDFEDGLFEHPFCDGYRHQESLALSRKGVKLFFAEEFKPKLPNLTKASDIKECTLFFDGETDKSIKELCSILGEDSYQSIIGRMRDKNLRTGLAILFYGEPGTGKTESVYQISRMTGRGIIKVDMAKLRDKYVGESEKNVKEVFDSYVESIKNCELTPILLLNEADAIIGNRLTVVGGAVDKMENSLQNIILDELERFNGILIATTNLQQNFDPAFERRFLYKVKFNKPTTETRSRIWRSKLPFLGESDATTLALNFHFSGGEIENIARKCTIEGILHGDDSLTMEKVEGMCREEKIAIGKGRVIGFIQK